MSAKKTKTRPARRPRDHKRGEAGAIEVALDAGSLIATLKLSRDRHLSASAASQLMELAETIEDDESIRAFAVIGAGEAFCCGFDDDVNPRLVETLALLSKPTVAILNGEARDAGLELALACDIRIGMQSTSCAMTQLQRGALPHFGGTQRLPRIIGPAYALRMLLMGEALEGPAALRLGLITYLADDREELARTARELLATLASRGPLGLRMVKDAVCKGYDMTLEQGVRLEEDLYALLQTSADRAEGVRAFLERRKPLFKGA